MEKKTKKRLFIVALVIAIIAVIAAFYWKVKGSGLGGLKGISKSSVLYDLNQKMKVWALKNLVNRKIFNSSLNKEILITRKGIEKTLSKKTTESSMFFLNTLSILIVEKLPYFLENGILIKSELDKKQRNTIKAIHTLRCHFAVPEFRDYLVNLIIRETTTGDLYYDTYIVTSEN